MQKSIGIAITTYNRPKVLDHTLKNLFANTASSDRELVVVIDDNSFDFNHVEAKKVCAKYDNVKYIYNEKNLGIAKSKNVCLKELKDCEHIFLFDDDCFPKKMGWVELCIETSKRTGQNHFQYIKDGFCKAFRLEGEKDGVGRFNTGCGCFLYVNKKVIDVAGGFNSNFIKYGYEHISYSFRIHLLGLNSFGVFLMPIGLDKYIHSIDLDGTPFAMIGFKSTMTDSDKQSFIDNEINKRVFDQECETPAKQDIV